MGTRAVEHAGKRTMLGKLIEQAVRKAMSLLIAANIRHLHGSSAAYALSRCACALASVAGGARPIVPPRPGMPVPLPPPSIVAAGACAILLAYTFPLPLRADRARLLLAAAAWDRYLGEPLRCGLGEMEPPSNFPNDP